MASLEFIRTRPEELGGGVETIPRNFIGQPISGIIGNRWKSSFRRLCLLLASLDWVPPPLSLFLSGSSFTFHVFHPFFTSRSIPAIVCLRTCAHIVRRERMILTRRKGKERREKKTSWTDDDGCSVCFNRLF